MSAVTVLDDALIEKLSLAIARTLYVETAAALVGVHRVTLWRWLKRGRGAARDAARAEKAVPAADAVYARLAEAVERTLAEEEAADLDIIKAAAPQQWTAAAWRRERRNAERWGGLRVSRRLDALEESAKELQKAFAERQPPTLPMPPRIAGGD